MFKIFIVEDELTIRTELKTLLEKYNVPKIEKDIKELNNKLVNYQLTIQQNVVNVEK